MINTADLTGTPGEKTFLSIIKRPFVCSVLVSSIPFALFLLFFTPQMMKNDDVMAMLIVSGCLNGQPDEHMIFTNVLIGGLLKHLYGMAPDVNWYGAHLYAVYYLSTALLSYSCFSFKPGIVRAALFLMGFVVLEGFVLLYPTFTTASSMAAQSGVFSIIAFQKSNNPKSWPLAALGVLMLVLSGLIRADSMYMILLISSPLLIWHSWKGKSFRPLVLAGMALILSVGAVYYDKAYYYSDERWREYYEFNKIRAKLANNPNFVYDDETRAVFDKTGWSPNDYRMFRLSFYEEGGVYSRDRLNTILSGLTIRWRPENLERAISEAKKLKWYLLSSLISLLLCLAIMPSGHRKLMIFSMSMSGAVLVYLLFTYYLPRQGIVAVVTFLGFAGIFFATKDLESDKQTRALIRPKVLLCILLAFSVLCLWQFHKYSTRNENHQNSLIRFVRVIANANNLYIAGPGAFPYDYISSFSDLKELDSFHIHPSGYMPHTPVGKDILTKFGIKNLFSALYERDDVLLMFNPYNLPLLSTYIEEHYGVSVYFSPLLKYEVVGVTMGIYRVLRNGG